MPENAGSKYRILQKIGEGGMGVVYLAEDIRLRRNVALKFLRPVDALDSESGKIIVDEARMIASLNHPNIVTIYEIGTEGKDVFIAMEYVSGQTIKDWRGTADFSAARALDLAIQICEGIEAAHANRIVHGDIKSDNIIVTADGRIKLLDFGLARLLRHKATQPVSGAGTPAYMAPEQINGEPTDARSDIFSLGVVLYEMFAGKLPFTGPQEAAIRYAVLNAEPEPPSAHESRLPPSLDAIVLRALHKDARKRYQQVSELREDLEHLLQALTPMSRRRRLLATDALRRWRLGSRSSRVALSTLGLLVLLGPLGYYFYFQGDGAGKPPNATATFAVLPFSVRAGEELQYLGEGMVDLLSTTLDGAGDFRTIDNRALLGFIAHEGKVATSPKQGRDIARRFGAKYYILGNIFEAGNQLQLDASLYEVESSPWPISHAVAAGNITNIFEMVDKLAAGLLSNLDLAGASRLQRLAALTTNSLPALKAYLEGESRFRKGKYEDALEAFQRAVTEDSLFALAYYRLSLTADWMPNPTLANAAAKHAVQYADRLAEPDRRLLEALRAWQTGEAAEAERRYRAVVAASPENFEAWFQLGEVQFHYNPVQGRSISLAKRSFQKALEYQPDHAPSLFHLARIAAFEKDKPTLENIVAKLQRQQPSGERLLEILSLAAFAFGDESARQDILGKLNNATDLMLALAVWNVSAFTDKYDGAMEISRLLTSPQRSAEARAVGYFFLAFLNMAQGRSQEALAALTVAEPLDPAQALEYRALFALLPTAAADSAALRSLVKQLTYFDTNSVPNSVMPYVFFNVHNGAHEIIQTYLLGSLYARLGNENAALRFAEMLPTLRGPQNAVQLAQDLAWSIKAQIAARKQQEGSILQAAGNMQIVTLYGLMATSPFYARSLERYMHAEALARLGRLQEALPYFDSFGGHSTYDLVLLGPSLLQQGRIYEKLGMPAMASRAYRQCIQLWAHCDEAFLPGLLEARERLAALANGDREKTN